MSIGLGMWLLPIASAVPATPPSVRLTEILAGTSGNGGLRDEDGELQDWIELQNQGSTAVNLEGWSLTDAEDDPGRWVFPSVQIPVGGYLVVFASGKDRRTVGGAGRLHTNFKLASGGEFLGLFAPDSPRVKVDAFDPSYPEQRNDISYGRDRSGSVRYYRDPTPGSANGASTIVASLPRVDFGVVRGWFESPVRLGLSCAVPGVEIRYTTDGSEPTATTGILYTGEILILGTRVIRAAAFREGWLPSPTETHTYLFAAEVAHQPARPPGVPAVWVDTLGRNWTADYEMDPEIVDSPVYRDRVVPGLRSLPVLSLVTRPADMFDNTTGIYPKSQARGPSWERPASMEILEIDGNGTLQADCGVQMQGNSVRDPVKTAKHSFRLVFKGDYGEAKLRHPVFPDSPLREFDTLILRADFNNSWMHWNPAQRPRGQRVRDAWMKDSQRAMGGMASHSRFFHLFVNGLYWGVYDATERPDASFAAAYAGGQAEDYDVINEGQLVDGSMDAYNVLRSLTGFETPAGYQRLKQYLDVAAYIDYLLLHFYAGHEDWFTDKNWYASRRRVAGAGFRYQCWDGELILNSPSANIVSRVDQPSGLHNRLLASAEYRLAFADRVQRHCFGAGALTPSAVVSRYERRIASIEAAMVAESARWGDYRRDVHPYSSEPYELYTPDVHFRAERQRLVESYFPGRTATLLAQLKAAGLFPHTAVAPAFGLAPGHVEPGVRLALTAPSGTVYYSTDETDPREAFSGAVARSATGYVSPLVLEVTTRIKARTLVGTEWSALTEGVFEVGRLGPALSISEIHYRPRGGDPYEFVEVRNHGRVSVDVSGFSFSGIEFFFPVGTVLSPGAVTVIASGLAPGTFAARYPGVDVLGWFEGQLSDDGERIELLDRAGNPVFSVGYQDGGGWPRLADGGGEERSLELVDALADPDTPAAWRLSAAAGGSPGRHDFRPDSRLVRLNEIHAADTAAEGDWLELHNAGDAVVDLSGWSLTDDSDPRKAVLPAGTVLSPGGFLVVACTGSGAGASAVPGAAGVRGIPAMAVGFALKRSGETVSVYDPRGSRVDAVTYGPQIEGYTVGRAVSGAGWRLGRPTPGAGNEPAALAADRSATLNEWLANAAPGQPDWLEIYNRDSVLPLALEGLQFVVSETVFQVRTPTYLAPRGFLVLEADGRGGPGHVGVKLPATGGAIALLDAVGRELETVRFPSEKEGFSVGRYPDGAEGALHRFQRPTPGLENRVASLSVPVLDRVRWESGELKFRIHGDAGGEYRIEWSPDLRNWSPVWSGRPASVPFEGNVGVGGGSVGFYRVVVVP